MNRTVTALTDLERTVLTAFAVGDTPTAIAKQTGASLDTVTGILTRRATMSRKRAADLVADPDPRELSPLTAPVGKANGKETVKPAAKGLVEPLAPQAAALKAGLAEVAEAVPEPAPRPAPPAEATITLADALDGMDELSCQIRDLVIGLAQTLARRHHARLLRLRVTDLEAQLEQARAELAAAESGGQG